MSSSFFNYPITRPYPYAWFTPVAIVGGICLLSLLSVLNFVQNSYALNIQYANDPNSTISNGVWFQNWPSYITRTVRPTCEPANFPLNTQFFTNQSGLTWTLTSVYNEDSSAPLSPSLTYMNNVLENCKVTEIQIEFDGTQDVDVAVSYLTPWDIQVRVFATCSVWSSTGYTLLDMTAMYDPLQSFPVAGSSVFIATDPSSRASMFWAQALLSGNWVATVCRIDNVALQVKPAPTKGFANLYPVSGETDITNPGFFNLEFDFLYGDETEGVGWNGPLHSIELYINDTDPDLDPTPRIWTTVDQLAKSMYSAALGDLGQISMPSHSYVLNNATMIQTFSQDFAKINELNIIANYSQLVSTSYNARQAGGNPTGPLSLTSSVIVTKYLCQVPHRKPIGDIFISVLLADLVLLQAAWKLYTFAVNRILRRRKGTILFCEGCLDAQIEEGEAVSARIGSQKRLAKHSTLVSIKSRTGSQDSLLRSKQSGRTWQFSLLRR